MRIFRAKRNFKAILMSKILSHHCSIFGTGNFGNHKSQNGCRSNFLLLTETLSHRSSHSSAFQAYTFLSSGLKLKMFLHVRCFVICQEDNCIFPSSSSHPTIIPSAVKLVYSAMTLEVNFHSRRKKNCVFPSFHPSETGYYHVSTDFPVQWSISGPATKGPLQV